MSGSVGRAAWDGGGLTDRGSNAGRQMERRREPGRADRAQGHIYSMQKERGASERKTQAEQENKPQRADENVCNA